MISGPEIPVPPYQYGGIERIIYMLVCGLSQLGHEVHLFAHSDSHVPVKHISYLGKKSEVLIDTIRNSFQIAAHLLRQGRFDVIHNFGRLSYLLSVMRYSVPKIQSYQRYVTPRSARFGKILAGKSLVFTACSRSCAATASGAGGRWLIIPNGVQLDRYQFNPNVPLDAPLVFLGRVERIKGAHTAIRVAQITGKRLVIAGNHAQIGNESEYFKNEILPHCDGEKISYMGAVDDIQKNQLLGQAAALLFPIEWEEPFGIVMTEALACGTPVVAFKRGAVPEIVQDKVTGFVCSSTDEMAEAVKNLNGIDRKQCRRLVEEKFSDEIITKMYEDLYFSLLKKC
jgi:glycosyltransferase involved in cell wall biosynthesis